MDKQVIARVCGIDVTDAKSSGMVSAILDGSTESLIDAFAVVLGTAPTFEQWEAARAAWREGYAEQREGVSANTMDKAWSRFAARLDEQRGLSKPKATSAAAVKKAEAREASKAEYVSAADAMAMADTYKALADGSLTAEDLAEVLDSPEVAEALKDITPAKAAEAYAKALKAAEKLEKAEAKLIKAEEDARLKVRRETLSKAIKDAKGDVLAVLEAALDLATDSTDEARKASAWAVFEALAPVAPDAPVSSVAYAPAKGKGRRAA